MPVGQSYFTVEQLTSTTPVVVEMYTTLQRRLTALSMYGTLERFGWGWFAPEFFQVGESSGGALIVPDDNPLFGTDAPLREPSPGAGTFEDNEMAEQADSSTTGRNTWTEESMQRMKDLAQSIVLRCTLLGFFVTLLATPGVQLIAVALGHCEYKPDTIPAIACSEQDTVRAVGIVVSILFSLVEVMVSCYMSIKAANRMAVLASFKADFREQRACVTNGLVRCVFLYRFMLFCIVSCWFVYRFMLLLC